MKIGNGTIEELINSIIEFFMEVYAAVTRAFEKKPGFVNPDNYPEKFPMK